MIFLSSLIEFYSLVRQELIDQLPEGQRTEADLQDNIRSPQFQQSLDSLSNALQSDGGSSLLANIGVEPSAGTSELVSFALSLFIKNYDKYFRSKEMLLVHS